MRMFTRKTSCRRHRRRKNEQQVQKYVSGGGGGSGTYTSFLPDLGINNAITNFFAWVAKCQK